MGNTQNTADLAGRNVLVTGGTKGIGKAIADKLTESGARVIITARNQADDMNPAHHFIAADFTKAADLERVVEEVNEKFGGIDILINNAGGLTTPSGGFSSLTDEHWNSELQLNLLSAIRLDKAFLPKMLDKKNGVIIHVSSATGILPFVFNMAYAVSKAALNAYSKALAKEVSGKGVRVLTVSPGIVKTTGMESFIQDTADAAGLSFDAAVQSVMQVAGEIPIGRMAAPEEIAELVNFLVSDKAAYLTGANYLIDGGALPVVH